MQDEVQMMTWGQGNISHGQTWSEGRYPTWPVESFYNLQAGPIDNSSTWGTGEFVEMLDEELSTKEAREGILGAIRATTSGEFTLPDPA